jgi:hypothetical protein
LFKSADDIHQIRKILDKQNSTIRLIAKIENQIGVDNIDEIIEVSDGIMVARVIWVLNYRRKDTGHSKRIGKKMYTKE